MSDYESEDDLSPQAYGKHMFESGEPLSAISPGDHAALHGYHTARAAEFPGAANCPGGHAEGAVRLMKGQFRALLLGLERHLKGKVPINHPV